MEKKSTWNSSFTILFSFLFLMFFRPSVLLCANLKTRLSNHPPSVQSSNRSSSVLHSSSVHRSSSDMFFLCSSSDRSSCSSLGLCSIFQSELQHSSFFLCSSFLFRFVLPLFSVFVVCQIVLTALLQVYCSSSTKIESQRLGFVF